MKFFPKIVNAFQSLTIFAKKISSEMFCWVVNVHLIAMKLLEFHSISKKHTQLKSPLSGLRQFLAIERPLKIMKNHFYFVFKALFVLEIFTFLSWPFGYVEKLLVKKAMVIFWKFMIAQTGKHIIITIHVSPNISRNKDNQAMKFGQLIKYSVKNIFLQKLCRKWGKETISRPLLVFYQKALYKVRAKGQHLSFNIFW